jgi:3-dehydroquinate dehydratase II
MKVLLLQGANMEYLGLREPELYGTTTAAELDEMLRREASRLGMELDIFYTNVEGEAISTIYRATRSGLDAIVMNPAGFMYAGFALRDCLKAVSVPCIEVHMTNVHARGLESVTACATRGVVAGFGVQSYIAALNLAATLLPSARRETT